MGITATTIMSASTPSSTEPPCPNFYTETLPERTVDSPYYAPMHRTTDTKGAKLAVWLSCDPDAPSKPPLVLYLQHDATAVPHLLELDLGSTNYITAGLVSSSAGRF
jgi:hypothetical protein